MTPFVGEIIMFGGNFEPRGWAFCNGQLLSISSNDALFALLGTLYGGDGRTTFGLPDLRGRVPLHMGTGPGLTQRRIGGAGGRETELLTEAELPAHRHVLSASNDRATETSPAGAALADKSRGDMWFTDFFGEAPDFVQMHGDAISDTGGGTSHNNMQPFQAVTYLIALVGIFPSRF